MAKQEQGVGEGSSAIQSGRDTNIYQGIDAGQIAVIVSALADQIPKYAAIAGEIVDARLREFEVRVLEKFKDASQASLDAFSDPDFQYLVGRAQHQYAKCKDETVHDILIDLIAQRSKENDRTRLSLSLNDAVEKSAILTRNEFAELTFAYLFRRVVWGGINNFDSLANKMNLFSESFLEDISRGDSSYSYLVSHGCASISIGEFKMHEILVKNYGGVLSNGIDRDSLNSVFPTERQYLINNDSIFASCLHDKTKIQPNAVNKSIFDRISKENGLTEDEAKSVWAIFETSMFSRDDLIDKLSKLFPRASMLFSLWDETSMKNLMLTTTGIAIAHANVRRLVDFDADLSVWIN